MEKVIDKTVNHDFTYHYGENAFAIMGIFKQKARKEGWSTTEISAVLDEAMKDDYDHLFNVICLHSTSQHN